MIDMEKAYFPEKPGHVKKLSKKLAALATAREKVQAAELAMSLAAIALYEVAHPKGKDERFPVMIRPKTADTVRRAFQAVSRAKLALLQDSIDSCQKAAKIWQEEVEKEEES